MSNHFTRAIQVSASCPCDRHDRQVDKALLEQEELFFAVTADSTTGRPTGISSQDVGGLHVLAAFADPVLAQARHPEAQIGSMPRAEVFDWIIAGEPEGLVIFACTPDDALAFRDRQALKDLVESDAASPSFRVPPGHLLEMVHLSTDAGLLPSELGFLVVDFGPDASSSEEIMRRVAEYEPRTGIERTIWVVQAKAASGWEAQQGLMDTLFASIADLTSENPEEPDVAIVEPGSSSAVASERFRQLGLEVHLSGPDGIAFAVVMYPDGSHTFVWTLVDPRVASGP